MSDYTTGTLSGGYAQAYRNLEALLARVQSTLLPALGVGRQSRTPAASTARTTAAPPEQPLLPPVWGEGDAGGARCVRCLCAVLSVLTEAASAVATHASNEDRDWQPDFQGVGAQDLYPPGLPRLPALGPFGPGAQGGGMLIGPHHPGFFPGGEPPGHPQRPPDLPPPARFDPFGAQRCT